MIDYTLSEAKLAEKLNWVLIFLGKNNFIKNG